MPVNGFTNGQTDSVVRLGRNAIRWAVIEERLCRQNRLIRWNPLIRWCNPLTDGKCSNELSRDFYASIWLRWNILVSLVSML